MINLSNELKRAIEDKKHLTRHFDLIDQDKLSTPITVIGAGGIGSWVTFALAKMGFCNIKVYDNDKVDIVNVGNQLYGFSDIGEYKVHALARLCKNVGSNIRAKAELFTPETALKASGIVIMAVDSMSTRAMLNEHLSNTVFMVDGRMGAEKILIYTAQNSSQRASYSKSLYTDENAEQVPCTAKATSYCALTIAGLIVGQVKSFLIGNAVAKNLSVDAASGSSILFNQ